MLNFSSALCLHQTLSRPEQLNPQGHILEVAIEAAATEVVNLKDSLNEWDSKVGDGDCGSTVSFIIYLFLHLNGFIHRRFVGMFQMCRGATAILEDMKK